MKLNKIGIGILIIAASLLAHGEDKPGPHGGMIQMPGAFHTEVLKYKQEGYKIYLLDINFENPTTVNSVVKAKVKSKSKETSLNCKAHPDHFYCEKNAGNTIEDEQLYILAERNKAKGIEVKYQLNSKEK